MAPSPIYTEDEVMLAASNYVASLPNVDQVARIVAGEDFINGIYWAANREVERRVVAIVNNRMQIRKEYAIKLFGYTLVEKYLS